MKLGRSTWSNGKSAYLVSVRDAVWARRTCLPCRNCGLREVKAIMERPGLEARVCEYEGVVQNECTRLKG
jgi:hypothetical protein